MEFVIKEGSIEEIFELCRLLPEFEKPYDEEEFEIRLEKNKHLLLICYYYKMPVGFKLGYDRFGDGSFYSWLGGVLPGFRKNGVAGKLLVYQEKWAKEHGFNKMILKTRNKFKDMLRFAISYDYQIIDLQDKDEIAESRIILQKILKNT